MVLYFHWAWFINTGQRASLCKKWKVKDQCETLNYIIMGMCHCPTLVGSLALHQIVKPQICHIGLYDLFQRARKSLKNAKNQKRIWVSNNYKAKVKYRSLSAIKTAQAALLFGDLQWALHAPQPSGPKQKRCTPPVSQFSCSPDWSLSEGGPPGEREPVFPVSLREKGELWRGASAHFLSEDEEMDPQVWPLGGSSEIWPTNYSSEIHSSLCDCMAGQLCQQSANPALPLHERCTVSSTHKQAVHTLITHTSNLFIHFAIR